MATATAKPRKQLADQLDRLDGIIDLLADGLPDAVADATRAGTRQALVELLADPEVIARLRSALAPKDANDTDGRHEEGAHPKPLARLKSALHRAAAKAASVAGSVANSAGKRARRALARQLRVDAPVTEYAAIALAIGVLAACVASVAPPEVAAALCGLGAAGSSFALLVAARIRRAQRSKSYAATVPSLRSL